MLDILDHYVYRRAAETLTRKAVAESAGEGSRTPMSFRTDGFEPSAYTIPPPRQRANDNQSGERPRARSFCHSLGMTSRSDAQSG
jgi:hypothetical protein